MPLDLSLQLALRIFYFLLPNFYFRVPFPGYFTPMTDYDPLRGMPAPERKLRKKLGDAMMGFVAQITKMATDDLETREPGAPRVINFDEPMRRHITEIYRQAVEEAAAQGIESAICWHTLAVWTEEGKERIGYFSRALECVESGRDDHLRPRNANRKWNDVHMRAECLFEIGRVHAHEG
ncbi:MAG: hypothetical protein QOF07_2802, partial [Bradyrhizobium sp.]|nr:hypothetical protein [Bradyrhizobium sp.]